MAILYIELEDEITTAAARVRATGEPSVALVLPAGSRIASSRINFRLLAKEAAEHGTILAVVSPEPTARSLASAAGLATFDTVARYEGAMGSAGQSAPDAPIPSAVATPTAAPATAAPTTAPAALPAAPTPPKPEAPAQPFQADFGLMRVDSGRPDSTPVAVVTPPAVDDSPTEVVPIASRPGPTTAAMEEPERPAPRVWPPPSRPTPYLPVARAPRRFGVPRVGGPALIVAILLLLAFGAAAAGAAYFLLPEARISVTPRIETFGPLVFQVTADPGVSQPDAAAGVVPAAWQETTVEAQDTFTATGVKVSEEKATGAVTFSNRDIGNDESIPKGSVVKTGSGVSFSTNVALTVPNAVVRQDPNGNLILVPGTASVNITASAAGTAGNVSAGTITVVPKGYNKNLLKVTNPKATSGGSHTETKIVSKSDYDAAVAALGDRLQFEFDHWVGSGADAGSGALIVAASAALDDAQIEQASGDVVGKAMDTFDLSGKADGRVVVVDPKAITKAGTDRFLATSVPTGRTLVGNAPTVTFKPIESTDPTKARYEITASGQGYRDVDAAAIKRLVLGKPVDEARAMLGSYGDATVTLRPDWFGTIPQFEWRVTVDVTLPASAT